MSQALDITTAIKDYLSEVFTDLIVDAWPDKSSDYDYVEDRGVALVRYDRSQYGNEAGIGMGAQERILTFEVFIFTRSFESGNGIVNLIEQVGFSLIGQKFISCSATKLVSDGLVLENEGVWLGKVTINMKSMAVPKLPVKDYPIATHITHDSNDHDQEYYSEGEDDGQ